VGAATRQFHDGLAGVEAHAALDIGQPGDRRVFTG
jgi:hypothetical protein